jgi:serine/threonine protein kinase
MTDGPLRDDPGISEENIFGAHSAAPGAPPTLLPEPGLRPGTRLGRYSIVEKIGAGTMGVVYRAMDEKLERTVAIKMLSAGHLHGAELRLRFRQEALALARLNHANIAAVYDVG